MKLVPLRAIRQGADAESAWLTKHGFDGLACLATECGCWVGDLIPCGERGDQDVCVPGHDRDGVGVFADQRLTGERTP